MAPLRRFSHLIGIDDAPFDPAHRGDVPVVGAVFSGLRLEGVLRCTVRRDGVNATDRLLAMIEGSRFVAQLQAVLLQGIALAGFNVIDLNRLHSALGIPLMVVARKEPDLPSMRAALLDCVPGGLRKWRLIERAGPMRPMERIYVQTMGFGGEEARALIRRFAVHSLIPEPLRTAHLIAGALGEGQSRHRV